MYSCTTCGKNICEYDNHVCYDCVSDTEQSNIEKYTERQINAFNDPAVMTELWNTGIGRWMLKQAAKEGLIRNPLDIKFILEIII